MRIWVILLMLMAVVVPFILILIYRPKVILIGIFSLMVIALIGYAIYRAENQI